jgi:RNA polymerase sigma-70 factor (ECF subfamily)
MTPPRPQPELPTHDDAALWRRVLGGDEEAFATLYREHGARLYRFALRMTGSAAVAEDVVQDVFLGVVRAAAHTASGAGYDPARGPLRSYLFGAARNAAGKRLREAAPAAGHEAPVGARHDDDTHALRAAILALDPAFREVVVLCELEGLSYEETARALGVPVGTVRSRLARARARLAARLLDAAARPAPIPEEAR